MRIPVLLFTALSLEAALARQEQEKNIQPADLSAPAEKTVGVKIQTATITGFSEEQNSRLLDHQD